MIIPNERLRALNNFDIESLIKKENAFRNKCLKNPICSCKIKRNELPWCFHIRKEFNKKYEKEVKLLWNRTKKIAISNLFDL